MSGLVGKRAHIWSSTVQMLADIDKDGPLAGYDGVCDVDARGAPDQRGSPDLLAGEVCPRGEEPGDEDDQPGARGDVQDPAGEDSAEGARAPDPASDSGTPPGPVDTGDERADDTPLLAAAADLAGGPSGPGGDEPADSPRYNKTIAVGFAAATVVTTLVVAGVMLAMRHGPHTDDQDKPAHPGTHVSVIAAPSTSAAPAVGGQDSPIPYTATAVGCLAGSSAAQSVAIPDPTQAWVCVHGGTVGQYLVINLGRTMVITAVSLTPGWAGADASGTDQWLQHHVVKRVQWSFNDSPPTVVSQETHSVHGEAPQPLPGRGVLASRIVLLIQETGRAPADAAPTTTSNPVPGAGGLVTDILGPPPGSATSAPPGATVVLPGLPADQTRTDPADNTFAVSSVKIFGHPPQ